MTPFSALLADMSRDGDDFGVTITEDWQQGRTTYGGLTAALCVAAAERAWPDMPPLRSAQFTFVGPAGGAVRMAPRLLRRGKSTVFVAVDLSGEAGLATHATLVFAAARQSAYAHLDLPAPERPAPEACPVFFDVPGKPAFTRHFEYLQAGGSSPRSGAAVPYYRMWLRHRDTSLGGGMAALVALADAPPPAAMAMFTAYAPVSTITWSMDIFDLPAAEGAPWRLMTCEAERVADGYSAQEMIIWGEDGAPLMVARQNVAVFG
jgi:acyl-CoA thioesterase